MNIGQPRVEETEMPKRRSKLRNPLNSHVSGMRDIRIRMIGPTEEEKEATRERIKKIHAKRIHKGHVHKNLSQMLIKRQKLAARRAAHRKKMKLGR